MTLLETLRLYAPVPHLVQEGAHRFTTARVAERAGVSVGSVYQYFPNKAAIPEQSGDSVSAADR
jgi:AcrR family transcriptional regulator